MLFSKYLDGIWFYSMNMSVIPSYVNDYRWCIRFLAFVKLTID